MRRRPRRRGLRGRLDIEVLLARFPKRPTRGWRRRWPLEPDPRLEPVNLAACHEYGEQRSAIYLRPYLTSPPRSIRGPAIKRSTANPRGFKDPRPRQRRRAGSYPRLFVAACFSTHRRDLLDTGGSINGAPAAQSRATFAARARKAPNAFSLGFAISASTRAVLPAGRSTPAHEANSAASALLCARLSEVRFPVS